MKHIVSFSGGKDSTAMLFRMLEEKMQIDNIIFIDTGEEFDFMYEHIEKVEKLINRKITRLKGIGSFEYYLLQYVNKKGKREGIKGKGFPRMLARWCTRELKDKPLRKFLKTIDDEIIEYHGIACDELERANKNNDRVIKYPLIEWKMKEIDCLNYCLDLGLDWNGYYEVFDRISCWCCPMQGISELKNLYRYFPNKWLLLKQWEKSAHNNFRTDYTLEQLEVRFKSEILFEVPGYEKNQFKQVSMF